MSRARAVTVEILLLAALLGAIGFAYADARRLSWTYDDAFLLRVVHGADLNDYFGSRPFWRSMPAKMFVPLLLAWYELGSRAGDEAGFYRLAIALLLLALAACYVAFRQFLPPLPSLTGIALIGLGPPVVSLVTQLMATHYLIALACSALAVAAFARGWSVLSAILYLAAMLAKEIALPLPLLLFLLPATRARRLIPHAMALVLYFAWRKIMLGVFLGGYGWAVTRENAFALAMSLPGQLADALTPPSIVFGVLLALVLLAPIALRFRSRAFGIAFIVALGCAIAPILPVARELQPRYAFATWVTLAVFFAIAARGKAPVCAIAVVVVALAQQAEWRAVWPTAARMSAESRFVLTAPADATLRLPATPPAAMGELQWLRAQRGAPPGLQWFYDDLYLCQGKHHGRRVFASRGAGVVPVDVRRVAEQHCRSIRHDAPLSAGFHFANGTLHWTFGPYERGTYRVVFADGVQAFAVPREDAYILGDLPGIALRVRYDAPEGWVTYSPELALDFVRRPNVRWHR